MNLDWPRVEGVVFDLDGTLVSNMALHAEAFALFLEKRGLPPLDEEQRRRLDGRRNRDILPELLGRELSEEEIRFHAREKEACYRELSAGELRPLPGALELIDALEAAAIPFGIATSAPALNVEHSLAELGLSGRFHAIARSDEMPRGKPAPDVFLAAAERLGVDPRRCIAFEDAPLGLESARAAGFRCVAIASSFDEATFRAAGHEGPVVPDFAELPLPAPGRAGA